LKFYLPSVKKTLGKEHSAKKLFAECQKKNIRQMRLCRVPEKQHSANHLALGKEPVSGSVGVGPVQLRNCLEVDIE